MSYILDALKKSERERHRRRGPDLAQLHHTPWPSAGKRRRPLLWVGLALGTGVALAAAGYSLLRLPAAGLSTEGETTAAAPPPEALPEPLPLEPAPPEPAVAPRPAAELAPLQELWELPAELRSELPALTFSFHVYAEDAAHRAVLINNRRQVEGDRLGRELTLEAITPEGVILNFHHHRIHVPVVDGW